MSQRYFLDTSYLLALELRNDQNHELAQRHWQTFRQNLPYFVTTSFRFDYHFAQAGYLLEPGD